MTADLPTCRALLLRRDGPWLHVTLNRPETRNALSDEMMQELGAVLDALDGDREVRAVILRGAGGMFCAGGDIKGFHEARKTPPEGGDDPVASRNREFGALLGRLNTAPQAVVAVIEGAAMGGGLGLVCVADVAIAAEDARFGLPEATLGLPASQVCLFLVQRIGLAAARRLAVTGGRMGAREAQALGLVHETCADAAALEARLADVLAHIGRCAPEAVAETKRLMLAFGSRPLAELQAEAARGFAAAMRGPVAAEGVAAFVEKRPAAWSVAGRGS